MLLAQYRDFRNAFYAGGKVLRKEKHAFDCVYA